MSTNKTEEKATQAVEDALKELLEASDTTEAVRGFNIGGTHVMLITGVLAHPKFLEAYMATANTILGPEGYSSYSVSTPPTDQQH